MTQTHTTDPVAFAEIERRVLALQAEGAKRISVRKIMEDVRNDLKLAVNNNEQTIITDALLGRYPDLAIETRKRGTRGRNKQVTGDLACIARALRSGAEIESISFQLDGRRVRASLAQLRLLGGK